MTTVRDLRQSAGISQAELARRSGVAQPNLAAYESGRRTPSPDMLARVRAALRPRPSEAVRAHRAEVFSILKRHQLTQPRVFGSVARGEDAPGSDLDLIVDISAGGDLLDLIDAAADLEKVLGCGVDIVTSRSLRAGHEIDRTSVPL